MKKLLKGIWYMLANIFTLILIIIFAQFVLIWALKETEWKNITKRYGI